MFDIIRSGDKIIVRVYDGLGNSESDILPFDDFIKKVETVINEFGITIKQGG